MNTQEQLEHAERMLACADRIDNETRRRNEMAYWQERVTALGRKAEDETRYLAEAVADLGDRHAG